jgi:MerR family mercuric resistance operon transcriptional regulator
MQTRQLTRGSLANKTGVNAETIRYYEKAGVMPDPPRTAGGHRIYDESLVKRLFFIKRCRELGFTLNEVRELLKLVDGDEYTCADVLQNTNEQRTRIKNKIRDLRKMEKTLRAISSQCSGEDVPECPIIDSLWRALPQTTQGGNTKV